MNLAISLQQIIRTTSFLVLGWGFWGRRIEWRYFHFYKIQDGGWAAILENTNGDISAKDYSIQSMFGSREGFSGTADLMTLFSV